MRLSGRLAGAIEVLADIEARRRPVADALKDWGLSHRFAGSGDRAAIGNIVYDALRMRLSHAWLMDDESPAAIAYSVLLRQWGLSYDALMSEMEGDKFAPAPLDETIVKAYGERDLASAPLHVQGDIPEWLQPSFERGFLGRWLEEAKGLTGRPNLDLRANTLKASQSKVIHALERVGAVATPIAGQGLRVPSGEGASRLPNVIAELSFQKGWFEVQDEGSQIVSQLVSAREGDQVLDFCAGGGGKTLALAAIMQNKGQIHAYDVDRQRLYPIIERLKRAGTRNVQVHDNAAALEPLAGRFDRVVVDAPCTGTGTWRRRPDTKWRLTQKNLEERIQQQNDALAQAATFVRPGGVLAYITCSMLPQENDDRISSFIEAHPDFEPVNALAIYDDIFANATARPNSTNGMSLTLTPATTQTDGFFFAMLKRKAS